MLNLRAIIAGLLVTASASVMAQQLVAPKAVALIERFEIGSPALYTQRYQHPVWPGGDSGVTIGIGYDLGFNAPWQIRNDWREHPAVDALAGMAGTTGLSARELAARRRWILTPYALAHRVFLDPVLVRYYNITRRAFPGMESLQSDTQGALVSLVYNRGGNMVGGARREMRFIRDVCVPRADDRCVAAQLRAMTRVWKGSTIETNMTQRRNLEADLIP